MNLQEFIDWRKDCFICGHELQISVHAFGPVRRLSLQDGWFSAQIAYYSFSLNLQDNIIRNDGTAEDVLKAYFSRGLNLVLVCNNCSQYCYGANIQSKENDQEKFFISYIGEIISLDKYHIKQRQDVGVCEVSSSASFSHKALMIQLPYIDLKKTAPEKLTNKIKTHIVFS